MRKSPEMAGQTAIWRGISRNLGTLPRAGAGYGRIERHASARRIESALAPISPTPGQPGNRPGRGKRGFPGRTDAAARATCPQSPATGRRQSGAARLNRKAERAPSVLPATGCASHGASANVRRTRTGVSRPGSGGRQMLRAVFRSARLAAGPGHCRGRSRPAVSRQAAGWRLRDRHGSHRPAPRSRRLREPRGGLHGRRHP